VLTLALRRGRLVIGSENEIQFSVQSSHCPGKPKQNAQRRFFGLLALNQKNKHIITLSSNFSIFYFFTLSSLFLLSVPKLTDVKNEQKIYYSNLTTVVYFPKYSLYFLRCSSSEM
jgi:hypothetical protein